MCAHVASSIEGKKRRKKLYHKYLLSIFLSINGARNASILILRSQVIFWCLFNGNVTDFGWDELIGFRLGEPRTNTLKCTHSTYCSTHFSSYIYKQLHATVLCNSSNMVLVSFMRSIPESKHLMR